MQSLQAINLHQTHQISKSHPSSPWTYERVKTLKKLWADGVSASLIARKIGEVSRNAVVGKVHRLGLVKRLTRDRIPNPPTKRVRAGKSAVPFLPRSAFVKPVQPKPRAEPIPIDAQPPLMKPMEALQAGDCRFPIGDPQQEGFGFCGHPKSPHSPYCASHKARCTRRGR